MLRLGQWPELAQHEGPQQTKLQEISPWCAKALQIENQGSALPSELGSVSSCRKRAGISDALP